MSSSQLSCSTWATHVSCLALTSKSYSSHTNSMGFKSTDRAGQDIRWRTCCSSLLLMYFFCGLKGVACLSPHIFPPIRPKDLKLWIVSPKDFIPLICCPAFVRIGQLEPFDMVWLSLLVVSWLQFCNIGQLHGVFSSQWLLTHSFTTLVQSCSDVSSSQHSVTQAGDSDEIVLHIDLWQSRQ